MTLPLGLIFALAAIASFVTFLVYAVEWSDNTSVNMNLGTNNLSRAQQNRKTKVEYSYQATVLSLLVLLVFFNGYHLTKFRM
jgi:hypothetical protein